MNAGQYFLKVLGRTMAENPHKTGEAKPSITAADLMITEVKTVPKSMQVKDLIQRLALQRVSGFPVVDEAGRLVGVISETDIVRAQAHPEGESVACSSFYEYDPFGGQVAYFEDCTPSLLELRVENLMSQEVITVRPEEPLPAIVQRLLENRLHRLVVATDQTILGLISTQAILEALASGQIPSASPAKVTDFMSDTPVAHEDMSIQELLDLLAVQGVREVPVVREDMVVTGVISQTDLVLGEAETNRQRYKSPDFYRLDPLLKKVPLVRDFTKEFLEKRVKELMNPHVIAVLPETSLAAAAQTMVAERVHRLLVVDPAWRLQGVLGTNDIIRGLAPGSTQ
jgi:CBS domain-containing protein